MLPTAWLTQNAPSGPQVGTFGIIHPEVLEAFDIPYPVTALELNIEPFCYDQYYGSLLVSL